MGTHGKLQSQVALTAWKNPGAHWLGSRWAPEPVWTYKSAVAAGIRTPDLQPAVGADLDI